MTGDTPMDVNDLRNLAHLPAVAGLTQRIGPRLERRGPCGSPGLAACGRGPGSLVGGSADEVEPDPGDDADAEQDEQVPPAAGWADEHEVAGQPRQEHEQQPGPDPPPDPPYGLTHESAPAG